MTIIYVLVLAFITAVMVRPFRPTYPTFSNWWNAEGIVLFFVLIPAYFVIFSLLGFRFPINAGS